MIHSCCCRELSFIYSHCHTDFNCNSVFFYSFNGDSEFFQSGAVMNISVHVLVHICNISVGYVSRRKIIGLQGKQIFKF